MLTRKSKTSQIFEMHAFNSALGKATSSHVANITTAELYQLADRSFDT